MGWPIKLVQPFPGRVFDQADLAVGTVEDDNIAGVVDQFVDQPEFARFMGIHEFVAQKERFDLFPV
jgi:hypothetical protein